MIKLNFNRFNNVAEQGIDIKMNMVAKTEGVVDSTKQINDFGKAIDSLNDKPLNINTTSIKTTSTQLGNLLKLINEFKKNPQVNITGGINQLKDFGLFNTLPTGTQKLLGELGNVQGIVGDETKLTNTQVTIATIKQLLDSINTALKETDSNISTASTDTKNVASLLGYISTDMKEVDNSTKQTTSSMSGLKNATNDVKQSTKETSDELKKLPSLIDNLSRSFKSLDIVKMVYLYHSVKRVTSGLVNAVNTAAEYEESLNLYSMAFGKYTDRATAWAKEISESLMLDPAPLMQYAGAFYNLTKGMGVTSEHAYIMSKNLTQLTYDMASYLNISNEAAHAKIQSAMAGQSRAVAYVGIATQAASLQELAYSMNIKKKVSEMTQAEKTYLRYIQLMKNSQQMQGDLGKTMITPANAIRLLKNQINLLSRAIGQVLTPIIMEAIPWLIALTNVLTKAASSLAHTLGYEISDVDFSSSFSVEDITDASNALDDVGKSAKKAGKSVSESLAPFDELNNVISETSTAGSASGGSGGLIDSSIWDKALPQYDMLSKYVGDMKKKAEGLEDTVKKILDLVKAFLVLGVIAKAVNGLATLINSIATIKTAFTAVKGVVEAIGGKLTELGITGENVALKMAASAALFNLSNFLREDTIKTVENVKLNDEQMAALFATNDKGEYEYNGPVTAGTSVKEIGELIAGFTAMSAAGFIAAGPIGGVGAAIGYVGAMCSEANTEIEKLNKLYADGYGDIVRNTDATREWNIAQAEGMSALYKHQEAELARIDTYGALSNRLKEIVDENGKVKAGYEAEAAVITDKLNAGLGMNIKIQDGQIENYKELQKEIDKLIQKKRAEVLINKMSEAYADSLLDQKKAVKELDRATRNLDEAKRKGFDTSPIEEERAEYERLKTEYDNAYEHYKEVMMNKEAWDEAYVEFTKGNYDEVVRIFQDAGDKQQYYVGKALADMTNEVQGPLSDDMIAAWQKLADDSADDFNVAILGVADPEARAKILANVRLLEQPLRLAADDGGELYASDLVYTIQDYLSDPNHSLQPQLVLPQKTPPHLVSELQRYFQDHEIDANITADTAPSEIFKAFINYFKKNPFKVGFELATGKYSNLLNGLMGSLKITRFDKGGYPTSGDLFFANENGMPEYITSIGGKSAVVNQQQMVQALTNAITAGFQQFGGNQPNNVVVYVGDKKLYEGQGEYQNRQNDRYGTTVVKI